MEIDSTLLSPSLVNKRNTSGLRCVLHLWGLKSLANYTQRKVVNYIGFTTTLDNERDVQEKIYTHT